MTQRRGQAQSRALKLGRYRDLSARATLAPAWKTMPTAKLWQALAQRLALGLATGLSVAYISAREIKAELQARGEI